MTGVVVDVKARACRRALTALNVAWRLRSIAGRAIVGNLGKKTQKKEKKIESFWLPMKRGKGRSKFSKR